MKRRTNPASVRSPVPRPVSPPLSIPQELVESVELWVLASLDRRKDSFRAMLEVQLAVDGVRIVPTSSVHKGARVHEVFHNGALVFTLSVGLPS